MYVQWGVLRTVVLCLPAPLPLLYCWYADTVQVRTSYLPSEILWGHDLAPLLTYQKHNGRYKVDFSQFDNVVAVDTPEMSAKDMAAAAAADKDDDANDGFCHKPAAEAEISAVPVTDEKCHKP